MKKLTALTNLPLLVLAAGLTGALARGVMYLLGKDETGLLAEGNPLLPVCWLLSAAVALCLWLVIRSQPVNNSYAANFPPNRRVMPAAILAAAGIAFTVLSDLNLLRTGLGLLCVPALVLIGKGRAAGKRPRVYLYGVLCLFYAAHTICCYRLWSGNPQTADYSFTLFACACMILSAYQRTAFCARIGHRRPHLFFSLMAGYFCMLCIPASEHPWLYLTSGCFFLTDLATELPRKEAS